MISSLVCAALIFFSTQRVSAGQTVLYEGTKRTGDCPSGFQCLVTLQIVEIGSGTVVNAGFRIINTKDSTAVPPEVKVAIRKNKKKEYRDLAAELLKKAKRQLAANGCTPTQFDVSSAVQAAANLVALLSSCNDTTEPSCDESSRVHTCLAPTPSPSVSPSTVPSESPVVTPEPFDLAGFCDMQTSTCEGREKKVECCISNCLCGVLSGKKQVKCVLNCIFRMKTKSLCKLEKKTCANADLEPLCCVSSCGCNNDGGKSKLKKCVGTCV